MSDDESADAVVLDEALGRIALRAVTRAYPNKIAHLMHGPDDAVDVAPRVLHPAFYGSFDWHSAVHGHWALVRLLRRGGLREAALASRAREVLEAHLSAAHLSAELGYVQAPGRASFERPYGLAWLLQLDAELCGWQRDAGEVAAGADEARLAGSLRAALAPLVAHAVQNLVGWLPRLPFAVRSGTHDQTAFALGLVRDWAVCTGAREVVGLIDARARSFFAADRDAPVGWEPSGHDFLSPSLAEADLMRRVLGADAFAAWFGAFLPPSAARATWLRPVRCPDPSDGHLSHLDGLNLSRAWMLQGVASVLEPGSAAGLEAAARAHADAGLEAARDETWWAGAHWLASFAIYLTSGRGLTAA